MYARAPLMKKNAVAEPETEASPMDGSQPAVTRAVRWRQKNLVVERKLGELDACLAEALVSRPRRSDVDGTFFAEIQARTDFLRTLIAAEGECHGGARPEHLVEAEARFAVLERTFEQWARSGVGSGAAPTEEEEPEAGAGGSGSGGCSCTDSCFGFECTGQEVALDGPEGEAAETRKAAAATEEAPPPPPTTTTTTTRRSSTGRRWWRRRAALCGAAGAMAVVALGAGLALEFAAVSRPTVHLVPT